METKTEMRKEKKSNLRSFESEDKNLICLSPDATLAEASKLMRENHIGDVIIVEDHDGKSMPVGIVTDRDLALHAEDKNLNECKVSDVMSHSLTMAQVGEDTLEMVRMMKGAGVTRLPLIQEDGSLAGIVTAKRLLQVLVQGLSDLTQISERQQENEKQNHH